MSDIVSRVLAHAPVDTSYVAGLWHPGRASVQGLVTEARVLAASLTKPRNPDIHKFLIISAGPIGFYLLTRLLNAHPDIFCGRELLSRRVLSPRSYLNRLAHKNPAQAFGMKLLSYQMVQVQRLRNPAGFLRGLQQDGFRFIHLERNTFSQTLSLNMAQTSRLFHQRDTGETFRKDKKGEAPRKTEKQVTVDIDDFIARLKWGELLLEYERHCLAELPYLHISYDRDLSNEANHQTVVNNVCDWIDISQVGQPVSSGMKKVLPEDISQIITNFDALATRMRDEDLAYLLPEPR